MAGDGRFGSLALVVVLEASPSGGCKEKPLCPEREIAVIQARL
jgi:hypothetical protein